jgi:hypothetical protein
MRVYCNLVGLKRQTIRQSHCAMRGTLPSQAATGTTHQRWNFSADGRWRVNTAKPKANTLLESGPNTSQATPWLAVFDLFSASH